VGAVSRRLAATLAVALLATVASAAGAGAGPARPEQAPRSQRVYLIADSVGLGARSAIAAAFPPAWQVTQDGFPALFVEQMEANHVRRAMRETPWVFGDHAIVAGGYNYPYWDPARFDRSIDSILGALREAGVRHIYWVTLREVDPRYVSAAAWRQIQPYFWYFPTVNRHLRAALDRHDDLTLIDWAAIANRPGLTYDAIHLGTYGAAEYAGLVASTVLATAGRLPSRSVTEVRVAGLAGVGQDVTAVALNLAVTGARTAGFLTAHPCGEPTPLAANLNHVAGQTVSASAVVPVGPGGSVCIYNSAATHLVVDVMGWFGAGGAYSRAGPERLADTRVGSGAIVPGVELRVPVPGAAGTAAILNVTAVAGADAGFVRAYPCGGVEPSTSNLNFAGGSITPNVVVVDSGEGSEICLRANRTTDLVVDRFGALSAAAVDLPGAQRLLDTRAAGAPPAAGEVRRVATGAAGSAGVLLNVTATEAAATGFVRAWPCDGAVPATANLNVDGGGTRGNFVLVRPDAAGDVCVAANVASHLVVDLLGTVGSGFQGLATPVRALDTRAG